MGGVSRGSASLESVRMRDPKNRERGCIVEWHVGLSKSFCHFTFDDFSWLSQEGVVFGSPLSEPWFEAVWAVVLPPDYVAPAVSQDLEAPDVGLPTIELNDPDKNHRYEAEYSDFTYNGDYRITFYARNDNGNVTVSPSTIITVSDGLDVPLPEPGDVNSDGAVNLADAILTLRAACNVDAETENIKVGADVDGDKKIGLAEIIYILQKTAELRN